MKAVRGSDGSGLALTAVQMEAVGTPKRLNPMTERKQGMTRLECRWCVGIITGWAGGPHKSVSFIQYQIFKQYNRNDDSSRKNKTINGVLRHERLQIC